MNVFLLIGLAATLVYGYLNRTTFQIKMWKSAVIYTISIFILVFISSNMNARTANAVTETLGSILAGSIIGWIVNLVIGYNNKKRSERAKPHYSNNRAQETNSHTTRRGVNQTSPRTHSTITGNFNELILEQLDEKSPKQSNGYILFFDTETNGLPNDYNAPISDLNNWPRMLQLAWILYDPSGKVIKEANRIIKPDGFRVNPNATLIHGISHSIAVSEGFPLKEVLTEFVQYCKKAGSIVAHNISFDIAIVGAELLREKIAFDFDSFNQTCTMKSSTEYCKIPGPYGYKWPKLEELYFKLFNRELDNAHDALVDVRATADCFWALAEKKVIDTQ
jgi:DNA polymerase-3 subunit epsilon